VVLNALYGDNFVLLSGQLLERFAGHTSPLHDVESAAATLHYEKWLGTVGWKSSFHPAVPKIDYTDLLNRSRYGRCPELGS